MIDTDAHTSCLITVTDLCHSIDYGHTASATGFREGPRFLRITDLQDGKVDWDTVPGCKIDTSEEAATALQHDDIVFARTGATTGKSFLIHNPPRAIFASYLIRMRVDHSKVLPCYLYHFFQSDRYWEQLRGFARGAAQPSVNASLLGLIQVPIPPLEEQVRIARRLTEQLAAVERARAAAQARLAAAQALTAAYLREAFGEYVPFSASVLRPVEPTNPSWTWNLLTDLARLATGHTPSRREATWWGGDIQWLQLPDIRAVDGRRVTKTSEQTNELGIANSSSVLLPAGTVCMSRTASVGFVTIMGRDMATSQDFVNWVCGPDLDPDFLMYLILRSRREIRELGSGATHHSIYFETVENFTVCVPPIGEQKRIATGLAQRIAEANRLSDRAREELAAIEALPAALLREAFVGGRRNE